MSASRQQGTRQSSSDRVVGSVRRSPSAKEAASAASRSSRSGSKSGGKGSAARGRVSVPAGLQQRLIDMMQAAAEQQRPLVEVAGVCLRMLLELSDACAAAVYLKDEQTQTLRCLAVDGVCEDSDVAQWQTLVDRVMTTRRMLTHASVTAMPLVRGAALEGVLVLQGLPKGSARKGHSADNLLDLAASNLAYLARQNRDDPRFDAEARRTIQAASSLWHSTPQAMPQLAVVVGQLLDNP